MTAGITKTAGRAVLVMSLLGLAYLALNVQGDSTGITYAWENFNLKVDSQASYNGFPVPAGTWNLKDLVPGVDKYFNFDDIKPGDWGENTISLHAKKAPIWVCLTFFNLLNGENGVNEPESHVDNTPAVGELTGVMEFFAWRDDGDNIFEIGEKPIFGTTTQAANLVLNGKTYPIADYKNGPAIPKDSIKYFGVYWCAGNLVVNVATATITCNGSGVGNVAQTDTMKVDVKLTAVSAYDEPKFMCNKVKPPKPPKPPKDEICEDEDENNNTINNNTSASSNTGGNTAGGGGTVVTGNATSVVTTINTVNSGGFSRGFWSNFLR
ncbi:MAG: hypothetical protein G01um101456_576 [Parcubacteria group bacterium Gr01-1014_56]|nr:MAG: hypothetical protein G01um101456_576 [Parcubacteria group bacterium Gr01-1014_56]